RSYLQQCAARHHIASDLGVARQDSSVVHAALGQLLRLGVPQAAVLDVDWLHMAQSLGRDRPPLLERLLPALAGGPRAGSPCRGHLAPPRGAGRVPLLVAHLQGEVKQILSLPQPPDPQAGFQSLGMDSLLSLQLRNRLQAQLGNVGTLSTTLAFDYPN